jgi:hypothetical protein
MERAPAARGLRAVDIGPGPPFEEFTTIEELDGASIARRLLGLHSIFAALLLIAALVPPPFIEQRHVRPAWSLARPAHAVIATQVTGVTPLNRKIRLYIRFIDANRSSAPRLLAPIQIFASRGHRLVSEMASSFPPPIPEAVDEGEHSPFHCVFESVLVNFDTCYFRALVPARAPEFVEVRWHVIRTFFASFELTFSLAFFSIVAVVVALRVCYEPPHGWGPQQRMTMNLSICVLLYDLFGSAPALFFPSFFTLALGEVVRSALRAFVLFYILFTFNSLLRGRRTLKTVVSLPPFALAVLLFASNAVVLVSQVRRDIEFLWPIAPDPRSPVQIFIFALLAAFLGWLVLLVGSLGLLVERGSRHRPAVIAVSLVPLLACFMICEVYVHDLRLWSETAVTFVLSNGGINVFCLVAEYLHWPLVRIIRVDERARAPE